MDRLMIETHKIVPIIALINRTPMHYSMTMSIGKEGI
jgi:hypothetical protein